MGSDPVPKLVPSGSARRARGRRWRMPGIRLLGLLLGLTALVGNPDRLAAMGPLSVTVAPPRLEYVVIGNATGLSGITQKQAQAILRGERTLWDSRLPVTVVLPGQRADYADSLARELTGMSRAGMQRFWLALVFQGRASPPVFHDSVEETVAFVRRTPGAIAIIPVGQGGDLRDLLIPWR